MYSGFRQPTNARGVVFGDDGTLDVEFVDTFLNAPYR
jgi:hypothetical protein